MEMVVRVEGTMGALIAGETLCCRITFTNTTDETEKIAWAGAQLHCQCLFRREVVKMNVPEDANPSSPITDTAFFPNKGEKGIALFSTPSVVLLCNTSVKPGDSKTVMYREQIPAAGPPSFHGRLIRYTYKLTVGAKRLQHPSQITRIPIRVIVIPERLLHCPLHNSPKSDNPFLVCEESQSSAEAGLEAITAEASRRTSSSFTLTTSGDVLGRVLIFRQAFRLGDEVTVVFDSSSSIRPVLQVTVSLMCKETVVEERLQPNVGSNQRSHSMTVAQQTECCSHSLLTHFSLPITPSQTQTFSDCNISVSWQLQFQLLVSGGSWEELYHTRQVTGLAGIQSELQMGPSPKQIEQVRWDLPVTILPSLHFDQRPSQQMLIL